VNLFLLHFWSQNHAFYAVSCLLKYCRMSVWTIKW